MTNLGPSKSFLLKFGTKRCDFFEWDRIMWVIIYKVSENPVFREKS
jgi:hypothetical protein